MPPLPTNMRGVGWGSVSPVTDAVDWYATGTLHHVRAHYTIRTDPLWILVTTARQGHEGSLEDMHIIMADGKEYGPDAIELLALRPDRPGRAR